ncbi:phosphatase PAP2 family protein [Nocardia sp. NPDC051463]|uniref:phosphatase PAP2 family protein n=1 Tax=Nocardia sp. NPDC051463 TaxID=3154845 RepID=UPI00344BB39C
MHPLGLLHSAIVDAVTEPAAKDVALTELAVAGALVAAGMVQTGRRYVSAASRVGGLLIAFAIFAIQVSDNGWLTGADAPTRNWFIAHRTPWMDTTARVITTLGSPGAAMALAALFGAWLSWRARSALPIIVIVATGAAASATSTTLKLMVGRVRPPIETQQVITTDYSFPSGHATSTSALVGITVAILMIGRSRQFRALSSAAAALLITLVAASRLYLGVHWLTDVIAGALLGTAFAVIGATVLYAIEQRRTLTASSEAAESVGKSHLPSARAS